MSEAHFFFNKSDPKNPSGSFNQLRQDAMTDEPPRRRPGRPSNPDKPAPPARRDMVTKAMPDASAVEAELLMRVDAKVNIDFVAKATSLSPREISRRVSEGTFPKPERIGAMRKAWRLSQIKNWNDSPLTA